LSREIRRIVVVTGAAGGIGRATVEVFNRNDWFVVGVDRATDRLPGTDRFIQADLSDAESIESTFAGLADLDHIDALVNNMGVQISKAVTSTTPTEWDTVMSTNLRAAYMATRLAYPMMRGHEGAIVNVSSVHAVATSRGAAAYATSKGALVALTRASALDLAGDRIRVNAVLPGAVGTSMLLSGLLTEGERAEAIRALESRTPLGRIGRANEIAEAILFLADHERSSFITGQILIADGGATARLSTE
jgi:glucose 1-dehydrogenase